jgi:amidohydrolase
MTQHTASGAPSAVHPLLAAARAVQPRVLELRRAMHARPEIGLQLPATQVLIAEELQRLGLAPRLGTTTTSVTAIVDGGRPGPTVLLRADMDALPLREDTGLPFASGVDGAMHACGHDTHVAMLLGAAALLVERRAELTGRVLLMFQPGEEGYHGARFMLEEGLLDDIGEVVGAYGLHISARYRTGTVRARRGAMMAAGDTIVITVRGRGGHASTPHLAADPVVVAAEIIVALQTMVTRTIHAFDPAVLTIAQVVAGTTTNIIPETATISGTARTVSAETRELVRAGIRRVAEGIAAAHGVGVEIELTPGYPVTVNHDEHADLLLDVAREVAGAEAALPLDHPVMGAEDFSYVLQRVPGAFAFLGATPAGQDPLSAAQNHSNRVVFDEAALPVGIAVYAGAALRKLGG